MSDHHTISLPSNVVQVFPFETRTTALEALLGPGCETRYPGTEAYAKLAEEYNKRCDIRDSVDEDTQTSVPIKIMSALEEMFGNWTDQPGFELKEAILACEATLGFDCDRTLPELSRKLAAARLKGLGQSCNSGQTWSEIEVEVNGGKTRSLVPQDLSHFIEYLTKAGPSKPMDPTKVLDAVCVGSREDIQHFIRNLTFTSISILADDIDSGTFDDRTKQWSRWRWNDALDAYGSQPMPEGSAVARHKHHLGAFVRSTMSPEELQNATENGTLRSNAKLSDIPPGWKIPEAWRLAPGQYQSRERVTPPPFAESATRRLKY